MTTTLDDLFPLMHRLFSDNDKFRVELHLTGNGTGHIQRQIKTYQAGLIFLSDPEIIFTFSDLEELQSHLASINDSD